MFTEAPALPAVILPNQPNFRPVGGLPTMSGQRVREGLLYRSGDFFRLSSQEILALEGLGIRMIIDFRSDTEVRSYPTPPMASVLTHQRIPIVDSARHTAERMLEAKDEEGLATILAHDYRRMIRDHQDDLRAFFQVLATTKNLPLVYHCAAGKDRTGIATYLLLIALGVSEQDARSDYMASNLYLKPLADKMIREVIAAGTPHGEILRPLMEVRESYLDAALDEINRQFGNIETFLYERIKVDKEALKKRFLTIS